MTVAQMGPLQTAVYNIVTAAAPGIQVTDYVLTTPPAEFIRLEGFMFRDENLKNFEAGYHSFEVHFFSRPGSENSTHRGQMRVKEVIGQIHAGLMAATILGTTLTSETVDVFPNEDGASTHGRARYSITL